jgi:ribonuclease HII
MRWIVGIDEAGYGPNLGPLVMTAVALRAPDAVADANLWRLLKKAVRRSTNRDARRTMIDDSKAVYSTAKGIDDLELGVLATVLNNLVSEPPTLSSYLHILAHDAVSDLNLENWYVGERRLPVQVDATRCQRAAQRFASECLEHQLEWRLVRSSIICPARFNAWLDHWGSKGAILGQALAPLLRMVRAVGGTDEPIDIRIDKHGGRNYYAALLQDAISEGMVISLEESPELSRYRVLGLNREMAVTFQPRADAEHFCVALASMVSKYIRELLMMDFNDFWTRTVPGLKPTAGYPGDSSRFYEAIRPAVLKLQIPQTALWRRA